jgi:hypothetical protein
VTRPGTARAGAGWAAGGFQPGRAQRPRAAHIRLRAGVGEGSGLPRPPAAGSLLRSEECVESPSPAATRARPQPAARGAHAGSARRPRPRPSPRGRARSCLAAEGARRRGRAGRVGPGRAAARPHLPGRRGAARRRRRRRRGRSPGGGPEAAGEEPGGAGARRVQRKSWKLREREEPSRAARPRPGAHGPEQRAAAARAAGGGGRQQRPVGGARSRRLSALRGGHGGHPG